MNTYSILRVFLTLIFILFLDLEINGAIFAFFIAVFVAVLIGKHLCSAEDNGLFIETQKIINFATPIFIFYLGSTLLMNVDLLLVKKIISQDLSTGYYMAATTFARVPYFIFFAFSTTLLPSVSKSFSLNDTKTIKKYIEKTFSYIFLSMAPLVILMSATSRRLIEVLYTQKYSHAGAPLSILVWGMSFLVLIVILTTIINAMGKPKLSMFIMLLLVPMDVMLNYIFIPRFLLIGAAFATTLATFTGFMFSLFYIYNKFQLTINPVSMLKYAITLVIIYLLAKLPIVHDGFVIFQFCGLFILYYVILFALRELKTNDFISLITILKSLKPIKK